MLYTIPYTGVTGYKDTDCPLRSLEQHDKEVEKRVASIIYGGLALRLKVLKKMPYDSEAETKGAVNTLKSIMTVIKEEYGVEVEE